MTLLKWFIKHRLTDYQLNDSSFCEKLAAQGVHTTCDLLFKADTTTLANVSNVAPEDLTKVQRRIIEDFAKDPISLKESAERRVDSLSITSSGCDAIDQLLLLNGIHSGEIVQISGDEGSGKTQLCFNFVVETLKFNGKVLFIDTQSAFSPSRLKKLVEKNHIIPDHANLVDVFTAFCIQDLFDGFTLVMNDSRFKLLVIDSLSGLLDPLFAAQGPKKSMLFDQVAEIGRMINGIRQTNPQINVVVVNYTSKRLHRFLGHFYSLNIKLSAPPMIESLAYRQIFKAEIEHRNKMQDASSCHFTVSDAGLESFTVSLEQEEEILSQEPVAHEILYHDAEEELVAAEESPEGEDESSDQAAQEDVASVMTEPDTNSSRFSTSLANYLSPSSVSAQMDLEEAAEQVVQDVIEELLDLEPCEEESLEAMMC